MPPPPPPLPDVSPSSDSSILDAASSAIPISPSSIQHATSTTSNPHRLSQPATTRIPLAMLLSGSVGVVLGTSLGAQTSALRFRAENSHRLPTSERGWYLYHKSKNYVVLMSSAREGMRMAGKLAGWTGLFFVLEEVVDRGRVGRAQVEEMEELEAELEAQGGKGWVRRKLMGRRSTGGREKRDVLSTVTAGLTTAGAFSAWNRLPWNTAARTVKLGFLGGLGYGLAQDAVMLLQGKHLAYVDWSLKMIGLGPEKDVEGSV